MSGMAFGRKPKSEAKTPAKPRTRKAAPKPPAAPVLDEPPVIEGDPEESTPMSPEEQDAFADRLHRVIYPSHDEEW